MYKLKQPHLPLNVLTAGSYDSASGQWTDGGTTYNVRLVGNTARITGTIPLEEADAILGLDAGNRLTLKFANTAIESKADLPDGTIVTTIGDTKTNTYTKDAFEDDGTLILVSNVSNNNTTVKIKWTDDKETVFTIDLSKAILEN